MKEQNNKKKGFSLVELIVVIAIMVVLVAVLAPVFTKYVEQSRRATDVSNAASISEAVLVQAADTGLDDMTSAAKFDDDALKEIETINSVPEVQGNVVKDATFWYQYDADKNTCSVYVGKDSADTTYDLATAKGATDYKNHKAEKSE